MGEVSLKSKMVTRGVLVELDKNDPAVVTVIGSTGERDVAQR